MNLVFILLAYWDDELGSIPPPRVFRPLQTLSLTHNAPKLPQLSAEKGPGLCSAIANLVIRRLAPSTAANRSHWAHLPRQIPTIWFTLGILSASYFDPSKVSMVPQPPNYLACALVIIVTPSATLSVLQWGSRALGSLLLLSLWQSMEARLPTPGGPTSELQPARLFVPLLHRKYFRDVTLALPTPSSFLLILTASRP